jgi:hypothetical protein
MPTITSKFRTSVKRITPDAIREYPWFSIAVFLAIAWYILTKLGNSATWVGDIIRKITNPNTAELQQHQEDAFDKSSNGLQPAQLQKCRADARSISISFGTYKGSTWWNRTYITFWDTDVFNILKNYTNPLMKRSLDSAYTSLYSDGRDLNADINNYMTSSSKTYLHQKSII